MKEEKIHGRRVVSNGETYSAHNRQEVSTGISKGAIAPMPSIGRRRKRRKNKEEEEKL